ncbi:MAG: J domain-containing protein [Bacteroidota bacterium]
MSYSQILRRINRLIKSTINDTIENLSKGDKDEMDDFDRDLRGEKRTSESAGGSQRTSSSESSGGQRQSGSASQGRSGQGQSRQGQPGGGSAGSSAGGGRQSSGQSRHKEGRKKPGEKDDAYYYAVLGLTTSATEAEIKKAYRKLMSQYHPDRVATLGEDLQRAAGEKSKIINEAYQIIERRMGFK